MNAIRPSLSLLALALFLAFSGPAYAQKAPAVQDALMRGGGLGKPCGVGSCIGGAYCEGPSCPFPVCYSADSPISMALCGGVIDACCGTGYCQGTSYCTDPPLGSHCPAAQCYAPWQPLSQVLCGGALEPGCGVGTCIGGSYCNDCVCYTPESPVSQVFCGCRNSRCGEIKPGCGPGTCQGGSFCDNCVCYIPSSPVSQKCCPGGANTFQHIYTRGSSGYDHAIAGLNTGDGGYLLAGFASGAVAMKTDATGLPTWRKTYPGGSWWAVTETSDGYAFAGYERLTKTDSSGNVVWSRLLPGEGRAVAVTSDGGLIVAGTKDNDAYLLKTDASGNYVWAARYGGAGAEEGRSVVETSNGFLLLGHTDSFGAGGQDLLLVRTDASGNLLWGRTVGGTGQDGHAYSPYRMIGTADGGFFIATSTASFGQGGMDMFAVKLDSAGAVSWARAYGGTGTDQADAAGERTGGGFYLMGEEHTFVEGITLLSVTATGTLNWARSYGEDQYFNYLDGGMAGDGGAWIATESHSHPSSNPSHWFYLLKTDGDGKTRGCCHQEVVPLVETSVTVSAVSQTVVRTVLAGPLTSASLDSTDQPVTIQTLCESSADYLCNGILTGECLCTP